MHHNQRHVQAISILAAGWLLFAIAGCGDNNNKLTSPPTIPGVMESDGQTWSRQGELSAADRALLDGYFRNHMTDIDNPLLEGSAIVYADAEGARRYYWFTTTVAGTEWYYLEFDKRNRFQGSGDGVIRADSAEG